MTRQPWSHWHPDNKLLILAATLAAALQWRVTLCLAALVALWLGARWYVDRKRKWFTVGGGQS